jgi:hypothetical protein
MGKEWMGRVSLEAFKMEGKLSGRESAWEVWYQDLFDRECPRRVEATGDRLVAGLAVLWDRTLREGVTAAGGEGLARFNLWLRGEGRSIEGLARIRRWVLGRWEGDALLMRVVEVHARLVLAGETSEAIARLAREALDREDFEARLAEVG